MGKVEILAVIAMTWLVSAFIGPSSNYQDSNARTDYKKLIIGTWEGRGERGSMYVTFSDNGSVEIDYSPTGGKKFKLAYSFKDERTMKIKLYPENLIIHRVNDDEIYFRPEGKRQRVFISVIYVYKFKRVKR